jgi:multidrug resistance efflux pump
MKRVLLLSMFLSLFSILIAGEHYARVEPWERVTLKAAASGTILEANASLEGRRVADARVIRIDDRLDRRELESTRRSRKLVAGTLELTRRMIPGLEESWKRQKGYYERMRKLTTASQTQKDQAYQAMVGAENQWLSTKEKALNLEKNLLDLDYKIAMLEDRIAKKNIRLDNRYLYKLMVRAGEYASPGMALAVVDDLSRAKLVLYLSPEEVARVRSGKAKLIIGGKPGDVKFSKIWKETDEKYISSYRAEIPVPAGRFPFSCLVKVEIR